MRRFRNASPPPPPRFVKKLLVHNEQLERKTRSLLTDSFDMSADAALRQVRQKIRNAKSAIMCADDDVRHVEDTVHKAHARDFLNIYNPRLGPNKPLYEFVEVQDAAASGECAKQVAATETAATASAGASTSPAILTTTNTRQSNTSASMSETSRYSSRSSRKSTVEGELLLLDYMSQLQN